MIKIFSYIFIYLYCMGCTNLFAQEEPLSRFVEGEFLIELWDDSSWSLDTVKKKLELLNLKDHGSLKGINAVHRVSLSFFKLKEFLPVWQELLKDKHIKRVEPNFLYETAAWSNSIPIADPELFKQWAIENRGERFIQKKKVVFQGLKGFDLGVKEIWNNVYSAAQSAHSIKIALIDSGVDVTHPDLLGNVKAHHSLSSKDLFFHGTHLAGIIAARHNLMGIRGVNDWVQIHSYAVFDKSGLGKLSKILETLEVLKIEKPHIALLPWGSLAQSGFLKEKLAQITLQGTLVVTAAGNRAQNNDESPYYPASEAPHLPGLLSVAATNALGDRARFSSFGKNSVSVSAPGEWIVSLLPKNKVGLASGTSMASAYVAGVAALLMGVRPELQYQPVKLAELLIQSSERRAALLHVSKSEGSIRLDRAYHNKINPLIPQIDWIKSERFNPVVSSPHPYPAPFFWEFELSYPGAQWIRVWIGRYQMENEMDRLEFYSGSGEMVDVVTGFGREKKTKPIKGDRVRVVFRSNETVRGWGFEILGMDVQ